MMKNEVIKDAAVKLERTIAVVWLLPEPIEYII